MRTIEVFYPIIGQKLKYWMEDSKTLRNLIAHVADTTNFEKNKSNLALLKDPVVDGVTRNKEEVMEIITSCIQLFPYKVSVYASLLCSLNVENGDFVEEVLESLTGEFQNILGMKVITEKEVNVLRLLAVLFAELANNGVVTLESYLAFLRKLTSEFISISAVDARAACKSTFAFVLVSSVIHLTNQNLQEHHEDIVSLLNEVHGFMQGRQKLIPLLTCLKTDKNEGDVLTQLWTHLTSLNHPIAHALSGEGGHAGGMEEELVDGLQPTLHVSSSNYEINSGTTHNIPQLFVPRSVFTASFPFMRIPFHFFDLQRTYQSLLFEESIASIVISMKMRHKDCTRRISSFLSDERSEKHTLVLEVIFGMMFTFPLPRFPIFYYFILFFNITKIKSNAALTDVLAECLTKIFERFDELEWEAQARFVQWFAYQLNSFEFKWNWESWEIYSAESPIHWRFFREAFIELINLNYRQRIEEIIPRTFYKFLPPPEELGEKYSPNNNLQDPGFTTEQDEYHRLVNLLEQKISSDELLKEFGSLREMSLNHCSVFFHSLIFYSKKSYTHFMTMCQRYQKALMEILQSESNKKEFVAVLFEFYNKTPQQLVMFFDVLMVRGLLDSISIVHGCFSEEIVPLFDKSFVWNLLFQTLDKAILKAKSMMEMLEGREDAPVESILAAKERVWKEEKEVFLVSYQKFTMVLTEYLEKRSPRDEAWFESTMNNFAIFARRYARETYRISSTLELVIFTSDIDERIAGIYEMAKDIGNYLEPAVIPE